jgi:hypothetical protein
MSGPLVFALGVVLVMVLGPVVAMRLRHRQPNRSARDVADGLGVPLADLLAHRIPRVDARVAPDMAPDLAAAERARDANHARRVREQENRQARERREIIEAAKSARWRAGDPVTPDRPLAIATLFEEIDGLRRRLPPPRDPTRPGF